MKLYQVDAFAREKYSGNPAAVCPLANWLTEDEMQKLAEEMNLSETAFFVKNTDGSFHLRWFTPKMEVRLCGHATLASAHIIFTETDYSEDEIRFTTQSAGDLLVRRTGDAYEMDFPSDTPEPRQKQDYISLIDQEIREAYAGTDDIMLVLNSEKSVAQCTPDLQAIKSLGNRALIITAAGEQKDFVSRVFVPSCGIDEDPVTGSAHTLMTPYWKERLGKDRLMASQISKRRGNLECRLEGGRVKLKGYAVTVMKAEIL